MNDIWIQILKCLVITTFHYLSVQLSKTFLFWIVISYILSSVSRTVRQSFLINSKSNWNWNILINLNYINNVFGLYWLAMNLIYSSFVIWMRDFYFSSTFFRHRFILSGIELFIFFVFFIFSEFWTKNNDYKQLLLLIEMIQSREEKWKIYEKK